MWDVRDYFLKKSQEKFVPKVVAMRRPIMANHNDNSFHNIYDKVFLFTGFCRLLLLKSLSQYQNKYLPEEKYMFDVSFCLIYVLMFWLLWCIDMTSWSCYPAALSFIGKPWPCFKSKVKLKNISVLYLA